MGQDFVDIQDSASVPFCSTGNPLLLTLFTYLYPKKKVMIFDQTHLKPLESSSNGVFFILYALNCKKKLNPPTPRSQYNQKAIT